MVATVTGAAVVVVVAIVVVVRMVVVVMAVVVLVVMTFIGLIVGGAEVGSLNWEGGGGGDMRRG